MRKKHFIVFTTAPKSVRERELQVLACFETFDTTSNAGAAAAAAAMAKGIITRLIDGIEFNSSR